MNESLSNHGASGNAGRLARLLGLALALISSGCAAHASAAPPPPPPPRVPHPVVVRTAGRNVIVVNGDGAVVPVAALRGYLGLELVEITPELRAHFGTPADAGVLVARVAADGPAAKGGIQTGDLITAIDGQRIETAWDVRQRVRDKGENESADVELWRKGAKQSVKVAVARRKVDEMDLGPLIGRAHRGQPRVFVDGHQVDDAIDRALRLYSSPEWKGRLDHHRKLEEKMQERTKDLEQRIEQLERQLGARRK